MKALQPLLLLTVLAASYPAHASVEIEISGGPSSKTLEDDDEDDGREETVDVKSTDIALAIGYRFKNFLSFGLIASYKNYDLKASAESLSPIARGFYTDAETFPSGSAAIESESASGSSKGIVFGPQITLAYPGKYFQPYFRAAYQMGTLKTVHEYKTSGSYASTPLHYDIKIEEDRKSTFTQLGLGLRVPMGKSLYFFTDAALEQMAFKSEAAKFTATAKFDGETFVGSATNPESIDDKGGGSLLKIGFGANF